MNFINEHCTGIVYGILAILWFILVVWTDRRERKGIEDGTRIPRSDF